MAVAQQDGALALLQAQRTSLLREIAERQAKVARLNNAIRLLGATPDAGLGTEEVMVKYLGTLPPGTKLDLDAMCAYAERQGWLTTAMNPRNALLSRLPKLEAKGHVRHEGFGVWYT